MNSLSKALKNKVTNKVGSILAAPKVAKEEARSRAANRRYDVIMDRRAMKKSGIDMSSTDTSRRIESSYRKLNQNYQNSLK